MIFTSKILCNSGEGKLVRIVKELCSAMEITPIVFGVDGLAIDFVNPSACYPSADDLPRIIISTAAEQARNAMVEAYIKPLLLQSMTMKRMEAKRMRSSTINIFRYVQKFIT